MTTVCIFPGLVRWGPLYDTNFPILIEHRLRKTAVGIRSSFLVFPGVVLGSGVHKELVAFSSQKRCLGVSTKLANVIDFLSGYPSAAGLGNGFANGGSILHIISNIFT